MQNIMSHRNDLLRLYNASSMNFFYQTSAQGKQGVIHLLNYSRRPASDGPLFYVKEPHKSARLVSPELASPAELAMGSPGSGRGGVVPAAHFRVRRRRVGELGGEGDRNETRFDQERMLLGAGALLALPALPAWSTAAAAAPTARVAVARCKTYGPELVPTMEKMFDQLGGLDRLVKGKTVAMKINLIGVRWQRLGNAPMEETFWTHPRVIGAVVHLMGKAGARRIRVVEGPWSSRRDPGRGHAVHELEAAGYPERRRQRGIREHQLPGPGEEILAVHGAGRGPDLPRLRPEPFL